MFRGNTRSLLLLCCLLCFSDCPQPIKSAISQQAATGVKEAEEAYQRGAFDKAAHAARKYLKGHPDDADAWSVLAYALNNQGEMSEAREAFEKAARLYEEKYQRDLMNLKNGAPGMSDEAIIESNSNLEDELANLIITVENLLAHTPKDVGEWSEKLQNLQKTARLVAEVKPGNLPIPTTDVTTKAVILAKQPMQIPKQARLWSVSDSTRVRVTLSRNGKVENIIVLKPLCCGLTEAAVKAASQVKFKPATKNGQPVSTRMMLEYSFRVF